MPGKKKKKKLPASALRFGKASQNVAKRMEPQVAKSFLEATKKLQASIHVESLTSALAGGNAQTIASAAGADLWPTLIAVPEGISADLALVRVASGEVTSDLTAKFAKDLLQVDMGLTFNYRDPLAIDAARTQTADLIVQVGDDVKEAVRLIEAAAFELGLTHVQTARAIREIVGLPPNWVNAPLNLLQEIRDGHAAAATSRRLSAVDKAKIRSRIKAGTVTEEFLEEMLERYTFSLKNRRALNIARTENARAANSGQLLSWKQAQTEGVLPSTTRKVVIVTPDDRLRPTHAEVPGMNVGGRAMDEAFDTPWGPRDYPPWEPLCRCMQGLIFPSVGQKGAAA